jgi:hypothetical protein
MNNCNGTNQVYSSFDNCNKTCTVGFNHSGTFPTDTSVPTAQCRLYHAVASYTIGTDHCFHTSGSTDGVCGSKCANLCYTYGKICTGVVTGVSNNDGASCLSGCAALNSTTGPINATSGNSVDCRIYHAIAGTASFLNDVQTHCTHATTSGNDVCGTKCEVMCDMERKVCAANPAFTSRAECITNCSLMGTGGAPGDSAGDTVHCRIYHLSVANGSPALSTEHCPHSKTVSAPCSGAVTSTSTTATTSAPTTATTSAPSSTTGNGFAIVLSVATLVVALI